MIPFDEDHLVRPWEPLIARCLAHLDDGPPLLYLDVITNLRIVDSSFVVQVRLNKPGILFRSWLAPLWTDLYTRLTSHRSHINVLVALLLLLVYDHGLLRGRRGGLRRRLVSHLRLLLRIRLLNLEHGLFGTQDVAFGW